MKIKIKQILIISVCMNLILTSLVGIIFIRRMVVKNKSSNNFSTTHVISKSVYEGLEVSENDTVLIGDSLTDLCEWDELFNNPNIKNRGISGDKTDGVLDIINIISKGKPKQIFLLMGINDLSAEVDKETVIKNYKSIVNNIETNSPNTEIFIQSLLPINDLYKGKATNEDIVSLNSNLQEIKGNKIVFINLYDEFVDKNNKLKVDLSTDGLHLNYKGYTVWKSIIDKYIK